MKQIITLTESELKRAVNKSIKKVLARPKRGWGDLGDHSAPERGYYYCEETDYSSGRVRRWIGDENDAKICRICSEGGAYGPFNSRSDAVNFMKHFDKDYRERYEKIYGKGNKDDDYEEYCRKMDIECKGGSDAEDEDEIYGSYDELDESKIRKIVKKSVKNILNETKNPYYPEYTITDEIRSLLNDLRDALISYVKDYKMYPCTGQILDYINYEFDEVLAGRFRKVYPMSQTPNA